MLYPDDHRVTSLSVSLSPVAGQYNAGICSERESGDESYLPSAIANERTQRRVGLLFVAVQESTAATILPLRLPHFWAVGFDINEGVLSLNLYVHVCSLQ